MGVITKVVDAIDDSKIREFINQDIDRDYIYCADWEVEMRHVNVYLNRLLIERKSNGKSSIVSTKEMSDARNVLQSTDNERQLSDWVEDLREYYFPVLEKIWD